MNKKSASSHRTRDVLRFVIADKYGSSHGGARKIMGSVRMRSSARTHYNLNGQVGNDEVRSISSIPVNLSPIRRVRITSPLSLRRDSFITLDLKDFFSSTNAKLCLSPTKIDGFPHSGIL